MTAYYNEIDPFAAAWLRNLISAGLIADGEVDERDIRDVYPIDLAGYAQCHFFAGIGGWSYALRLAGWPDDKPCWTGSCPCQPFSAAGQGAGFDDERHLWPAFFHLIEQCEPPVVFGEQVASKAGLAWLDLVQTDLEASDYATAAVDLCAAGIGAPHIRQRLFWCADSLWPGRAEGRTWARNGSAAGSSGIGIGGHTAGLRDRAFERQSRSRNGSEIPTRGPSSLVLGANAKHPQRGAETPEHAESHGWDGFGGGGLSGIGSNTKYTGSSRSRPQPQHQSAEFQSCDGNRETLDIANSNGRNSGAEREQRSRQQRLLAEDCGLGLDSNTRRQGLQEQLLLGRISIATMEPSEGEAFVGAGYTRGFWAGCDWWHGRDEKFRPIEPGVQPLASGVQKRMGKLRGYGNAIVPQVAAEFLKAYMDCRPEASSLIDLFS